MYRLTPIEKSARNSIIWQLDKLGFNVVTIAHVMNLSQSNVSRIIAKKPSGWRVMDTVLFGASSE